MERFSTMGRGIGLLLTAFSSVYDESGRAVAGLGYGPKATKIAQACGFVFMLVSMAFVFYIVARGVASLL